MRPYRFLERGPYPGHTYQRYRPGLRWYSRPRYVQLRVSWSLVRDGHALKIFRPRQIWTL
jgi:hypothetical protein